MYRRLSLFFFLILVLPVISCSQQTKKNVNYVNDWAHVLTTDQVDTLTGELKSLEDSIGSQIVVLIIETLGGDSIESYSLQKATEWKIGRKDFNDGILITMSMMDREMRIEVGRGLEKIIRDEVAARIIQEDMAPKFKEEKYYEGLLAGISQLKTLIYEKRKLIGESPY